jgi:hypothetical protein
MYSNQQKTSKNDGYLKHSELETMAQKKLMIQMMI